MGRYDEEKFSLWTKLVVLDDDKWFPLWVKLVVWGMAIVIFNDTGLTEGGVKAWALAAGTLMGCYGWWKIISHR